MAMEQSAMEDEDQPGAPSIWHWGYQTADGTPIEPLPAAAHVGAFPRRPEAEDWIVQAYEVLLSEGVDQVVLFEGEVMVYAMSLHAEDPAG